jgi:hypothetical protein
VEYEIRDGEVIYADSGPVRVTVTEAEPGATASPPCASSAEGSSRCTAPTTGSTAPATSPGSPT